MKLRGGILSALISFLSFLKKNWFLFGIFAALALGSLFPDFGTTLNKGSIFNTALVVLLFLISGLRLPSENIVSGLKNIRLHLYIQAFIFLFIPLFFLVTSLPFRGVLDGTLAIGIYALACLPTTISSCIIFTQLAEGNVPATMLNAALANTAGPLISPLLLSLLLQSSGSPLPHSVLLHTLQNLALKMLLPIVIGQVLRVFVKRKVDSHKKGLGVLSNVFILLILFLAFAKTARDPVFFVNLKLMPIPFLYLALAHFVLLAIAYAGGRLFKIPKDGIISILFTAPQKTLAMGVPLLTTFFDESPEILGIALLPLLFYHPWQLLVAGFLPRLTEKIPPIKGTRRSQSGA